MEGEQLTVQLDLFEGPMDLLLHLIEKNKIEISDIPISEITEQYFDYLQKAQSMNLELASSFLVMAAQLVRIKVKLLLPRHTEDEEDPRHELVDRLVEYRFFKEQTEWFQERHEKHSAYFYREIDEKLLKAAYQIRLPLEGQRVESLEKAMEAILERCHEAPMVVQREHYQLEDFIQEIYERLDKDGISFEALFESYRTRQAVITMFLALLECWRQNRIFVQQGNLFGQIRIYPNEDEL